MHLTDVLQAVLQISVPELCHVQATQESEICVILNVDYVLSATEISKLNSGDHEFSRYRGTLYDHKEIKSAPISQAVLEISVPLLYHTRNGYLLQCPLINCLNRYPISERPTRKKKKTLSDDAWKRFSRTVYSRHGYCREMCLSVLDLLEEFPDSLQFCS